MIDDLVKGLERETQPFGRGRRKIAAN
jgi:hypothetical protein